METDDLEWSDYGREHGSHVACVWLDLFLIGCILDCFAFWLVTTKLTTLIILLTHSF
jgi:hypothetical protein